MVANKVYDDGCADETGTDLHMFAGVDFNNVHASGWGGTIVESVGQLGIAAGRVETLPGTLSRCLDQHGNLKWKVLE